MKTKNIILGMVAVAMTAALTGCYEKFNEPAPLHRWTREEIAADYQLITIEQLRQLFYNAPGLGDPTNTSTYDEYYLVEGNYAIEGKVISNDAFGNFYRSLFIQDIEGTPEDRRGMEIKVGLPSMHLSYPVGTTIFVICKGLAIGNYRSNLSLGLADGLVDPATGYKYANKYIDVRSLVDHHIRRGQAGVITEEDIFVIDSENIANYYTTTSYGDKKFNANLSGRLVRFEGAECTWGNIPAGSEDFFPSFQNSAYDNVLHIDNFNAWVAYDALVDEWAEYDRLIAAWTEYDRLIAEGKTATQPTEPRPTSPPTTPRPTSPPTNPRPANFYSDPGVSTWAFQEYQGATRYYGNVRFTVADVPIIVRTSGYSRFALDAVPDNGDIVSMTGIVNLYTSRSGSYPANQFMLNNSSDVVEE